MVLTTGIADDLSGAAETAAALGDDALVVLVGATPNATGTAGTTDSRLTVYDCNVRYTDAETAETRLRVAMESNPGSRLFVKVDSLLRGNLRATIRAVHATGRPTVIAPALPAAGRTLVGGAPLVSGRPLAETGLWDAESSAPPEHLGQFLTDVPHRLVALDRLRDGSFRTELAEARRRGEVAVADAATDADLDEIARAAWGPRGDPTTILVGSRALAEAARRITGPAGGSGARSGPQTSGHCAVLVVVGSADAGAHRQFEHLAADPGVKAISLAPAALLEATCEPLVPAAGVTAVRIAPDISGLPTRSRALAEALARFAAAALGSTPTTGADLGTADVGTVVVIGGETARALLDHLGVGELRILATDGDGVVRSLVEPPAHRPFQLVTRPGSFGPADGLATLIQRLEPSVTRKASS